MRVWFALALFAAGCGSSPTTPSPTPTPQPQPQPISIRGALISTTTGATIGELVQSVNMLPAQVTVSVPGYITRSTWIFGPDPRIDLFPEAGFDLAFYRQFARNGLESPHSLSALRVLRQAPSIYLQTAGLSATNVAALEAAARAVVPALTGGRFQVVTWETGAEIHTEQSGWIVVEIRDSSESCGQAKLGASTGHIWLNIASRCAFGGFTVYPNVFAHEIGHALGFSHVAAPDALMRSGGSYVTSGPSPLERSHAAFAYARQAGNTDLDNDPRSPSTFQATAIIVD